MGYVNYGWWVKFTRGLVVSCCVLKCPITRATFFKNGRKTMCLGSSVGRAED